MYTAYIKKVLSAIMSNNNIAEEEECFSETPKKICSSVRNSFITSDSIVKKVKEILGNTKSYSVNLGITFYAEPLNQEEHILKSEGKDTPIHRKSFTVTNDSYELIRKIQGEIKEKETCEITLNVLFDVNTQNEDNFGLNIKQSQDLMQNSTTIMERNCIKSLDSYFKTCSGEEISLIENVSEKSKHKKKSKKYVSEINKGAGNSSSIMECEPSFESDYVSEVKYTKKHKRKSKKNADESTSDIDNLHIAIAGKENSPGNIQCVSDVPSGDITNKKIKHKIKLIDTENFVNKDAVADVIGTEDMGNSPKKHRKKKKHKNVDCSPNPVAEIANTGEEYEEALHDHSKKRKKLHISLSSSGLDVDVEEPKTKHKKMKEGYDNLMHNGVISDTLTSKELLDILSKGAETTDDDQNLKKKKKTKKHQKNDNDESINACGDEDLKKSEELQYILTKITEAPDEDYLGKKKKKHKMKHKEKYESVIASDDEHLKKSEELLDFPTMDAETREEAEYLKKKEKKHKKKHKNSDECVNTGNEGHLETYNRTCDVLESDMPRKEANDVACEDDINLSLEITQKNRDSKRKKHKHSNREESTSRENTQVSQLSDKRKSDNFGNVNDLPYIKSEELLDIPSKDAETTDDGQNLKKKKKKKHEKKHDDNDESINACDDEHLKKCEELQDVLTKITEAPDEHYLQKKKKKHKMKYKEKYESVITSDDEQHLKKSEELLDFPTVDAETREEAEYLKKKKKKHKKKHKNSDECVNISNDEHLETNNKTCDVLESDMTRKEADDVVCEDDINLTLEITQKNRNTKRKKHKHSNKEESTSWENTQVSELPDKRKSENFENVNDLQYITQNTISELELEEQIYSKKGKKYNGTLEGEDHANHFHKEKKHKSDSDLSVKAENSADVQGESNKIFEELNTSNESLKRKKQKSRKDKSDSTEIGSSEHLEAKQYDTAELEALAIEHINSELNNISKVSVEHTKKLVQIEDDNRKRIDSFTYNCNFEKFLDQQLITQTESEDENSEQKQTKKSSKMKGSESPSDTDMDTEQDKKNEILGNLNILISWEILPLHALHTTPNTLSCSNEKVKNMGLEINNGPYSKVEDDIIKNNWLDFCKVHDLPNDPSLFFKFKDNGKMLLNRSERLKFCQFIGRNLPNRLLFSVHGRFQKLFMGKIYKKGRFTKEEDEIILKMGKRKVHQWAALEKELKRSRKYIQSRYNTLMKLQASAEESVELSIQKQEFIQTMMEVTLSVSVEELEHKIIKDEEWSAIANRMKLNVGLARRFWYAKLYPHFFIEDTSEEGIRGVMLDVIARLKSKNVDDWKLINWNEIAAKYKGWSGIYIYYRFKSLVSRNVPERRQSDLKACLDILEVVIHNCHFRVAHYSYINNELICENVSYIGHSLSG